MNIAICDDEKRWITDLSKAIRQYEGFTEELEIKGFLKGTTLLKHMEEVNNFDVVFMDIEIGEEDGINTVRILKELHPQTLVVFATSFKTYCYDAIRVDAFDFLTKPVEREELFGVLERLCRRIHGTSRKYYYIKTEGTMRKIDLNKVICLESEKRNTKIELKNNENYTFGKKLDEAFQEITELHRFFARINKSIVVNMIQIEKYTFRSVFLHGQEIKVSPKYKEDFEKIITELINGRN